MLRFDNYLNRIHANPEREVDLTAEKSQVVHENRFHLRTEVFPLLSQA